LSGYYGRVEDLGKQQQQKEMLTSTSKLPAILIWVNGLLQD